MIWWEDSHLKETRTTYFKHMILAFRISFIGLKMFVICPLHAIIPNMVPWALNDLVQELMDVVHDTWFKKEVG